MLTRSTITKVRELERSYGIPLARGGDCTLTNHGAPIPLPSLDPQPQEPVPPPRDLCKLGCGIVHSLKCEKRIGLSVPRVSCNRAYCHPGECEP